MAPAAVVLTMKYLCSDLKDCEIRTAATSTGALATSNISWIDYIPRGRVCSQRNLHGRGKALSLVRKDTTCLISSESEEGSHGLASPSFQFRNVSCSAGKKVSHHLIICISITGAEQASPRTSLPIGALAMDCSRREAFGDCASANSCTPVTYPFQTVFEIGAMHPKTRKA